jgi:hypothetical protein
MQRCRSQVMIFAVTVIFGAAVALAQEKPAKAEKAAQPAATNSGFEKLKQLAGEWVPVDEARPQPGEKKDEKAEKKPDATPICVYRTVSAGSAVQETLFPGTPHEMVTMYHLDGADLVLTHYCALGNQPRMRAEASADPNKLVFKFAGGTNIDAQKDTHMHDLTLTFVGPDRIRAEWTLYEGGKAGGVKTFEMIRKK